VKLPRKGSLLREIPVLIVVSLFISIIIKAFLIQAFYIPSGSMQTTLEINDRVIVNKLGNFFTDVERGDVVVFRDPGGWLPPAYQEKRSAPLQALRNGLVFVGLAPDPAKQHLIKRVIGVGGDRIVCCDASGALVINGKPVQEKYLYEGNAPSEMKFDVTGPKGSLWAMGDHRAASEDSRYHQEDPNKGMVPLNKVVGRAFLVIWPVQHFSLLPRPDALTAIPVK
jgi:signal peptidase I